MSELPSVLVRGERARLFPVLADTSKEGRTLSIVLACLQNVDEFGRGMLAGVGLRLGVRAKIETFTEVVLQKHSAEQKFRPDGLIVVRLPGANWSALVEAKVGNSELSPEQITSYIDLAKLNGIDAVITLSNQFAPLPEHHPVILPAHIRKKVELFHWSWMYVLTEATLLLGNEEVRDADQRVILREMVRFLSHPSAGVKGFEQMPAAWSDICQAVAAGGSISPNSTEAKEVVGAWHQEVRDLSLMLSRQLATDVSVRVPRSHLADAQARERADAEMLARENCLRLTLEVPGAAAPIEVTADIPTRSVNASMRLRPPADRKTVKAKVAWLLRQLEKSDPAGIYVRLTWPGRSVPTQYSLAALRENAEHALREREGWVLFSFEVILVRDLAGRFAQRRNFISELEALLSQFYDQVGQRLKAWQAPAPKLKEERVDAGSVSPEAIAQVAEAAANAETGWIDQAPQQPPTVEAPTTPTMTEIGPTEDQDTRPQ